MDIRTYTASRRGAAAELARAINVSPSYLSQMASGLAPVSAERSVAIERATAGAVTRQDLRPDDYWLIWPDLPTPTQQGESGNA